MKQLKKCTIITSNLNSIVQWKDYKVTKFNKKVYLARLRRETSRLTAGCFPSFIWHQPSHMKAIKPCTDVTSNYSEYNDKLQGNNIQLEMSLIVRPQVNSLGNFPEFTCLWTALISYMKQIKKCISVVSNLARSIAVDCKIIKFRLQVI